MLYQEPCITLHIIIVHACPSDILTRSTLHAWYFFEKDTLFRTNAAEMHRSLAAKETVHMARYLFWGSGGKVCGYIVVQLGIRWWQAATAGDAVSLSASTVQPTHWKEQSLGEHFVRGNVRFSCFNSPNSQFKANSINPISLLLTCSFSFWFVSAAMACQAICSFCFWSTLSHFRTDWETWCVGCQWWQPWLGDFHRDPGWKVRGLERSPTTSTGRSFNTTTQQHICNMHPH